MTAQLPRLGDCPNQYQLPPQPTQLASHQQQILELLTNSNHLHQQQLQHPLPHRLPVNLAEDRNVNNSTSQDLKREGSIFTNTSEYENWPVAHHSKDDVDVDGESSTLVIYNMHNIKY